MVGYEILVWVAPEKRYEFLQTFKLLSRPDKREGACLGHSLFEDVGEPNRFLWIECWTDFKELEEHLQSGRFRTRLGAIEVLGKLENQQLAEFTVLHCTYKGKTNL